MSEAHFGKTYTNFVLALVLLFPIVINSVKILGNLILLILVFMGTYVAVKEKTNPFKIKELKLLSWITVGYFLAMLFSILAADGLQAQFHHLGRKAHFLLAPLIALALYKVNIPLRQLLLSLKIGLILIGIVTIVQYFSGHVRPSGMINANVFSDLAVAMFFLAIVRIFEETPKERIVSILSATMGMAAILLSSSRGSWLSFAILSVVYLSIVYSTSLKGRHRRQWSLLALLVITLGIVAPQAKVGQKIGIAIDNIQNWQQGSATFTSSGVRMEMWQSGLMAAWDSPWLGYGYRNANKVAAEYASQNHERIRGFTHLHNEYITNFASAGILGLLSLLGLLFLPLRIFVKHAKQLKDRNYFSLMGILLCAGYVTFGFSHIAFGEEHVNAFYVLFLSLLLPIVLKERISTES